MYADTATIDELSRPLITDVWRAERPAPVMSAPRIDHRLLEITERCSGFLELPENWNSYRSRRVDETLLKDGLELLARLLTPDAVAPDIVPTARGGIQIEWHAPNEDLEIEVRALGRYFVFHRRGDTERDFEALDDLSEITPLVRSFAR